MAISIRTMRSAAAFSIGALSLLFTALMLWARSGGPGDLAMAFTAVASGGYVLTAVLAGGFTSRYGILMTAGLVFCLLGDLLGPGNFMLGLYAFVIAHFGIAGALFSKGFDRKRARFAVPAAILISAAVYFLWLGPAVPASEQLQIIGYTVVITVMLVAAGSARPFRGLRVAQAGAVLFYISDVFLANWRYVNTARWNMFVCYPLYYTACVLLAVSILFVSKRE
jgi:uncharacterized membrane protein YhhN